MQINFLRLFFYLILVTPCFSYAWQDSLFFKQRHFTDADGLPQNSVKSIAKDKDGFLWLTTENGLVRFDGQLFYNWSKQIATLHSSRFSVINHDLSSGDLFAINTSGEALRIRNGRASVDNGLCAAWQQKLAIFPRLDYLWKDQMGAIRLPMQANGFYHVGIDTFLLAGKSKMYLKAGNKLLTLSANKTDSTQISYDRWDDLFLYQDTLYAWHGTDTVFQSSGSLRSWFVIEGLKGVRRASNYKIFRPVDEENCLVICFGSDWHSLKKEGGKFISRPLLRNFSWEENRVVSAFFDQEHNSLFIGSSTEGLFQFSFPPFRVLTTGNSKLDNVYYAQTLYGTHQILSAQGHIINLDQHSINKVAVSRFTNADKYSIVQDEDGFIWTKNAKSLIRLNASDLRELERWEMNEFITNLYIYGDSLYVGTQDGKIFVFRTAYPEGKPEFFANLPASPTYFQKKGSYLWGASENGLYRLAESGSLVYPVKELEGIYIRSIYVASEQEIWISTYENGFFLLQGNKLTRFPVGGRGELLTVHCIIDDLRGRLWISTNQGLYETDKNDLLRFANDHQDQLYYYAYKTDDGLSTNEFNGGCQPCGLLLPDGWVSLPSLNGLVSFNPDQIQHTSTSKRIFIDRILVDGSSVEVSDRIQVSRFAQQVKIAISTPQWDNGNGVKWQYALKSATDSNWLEPDNNLVSLSMLPSGKHTLLIRKLNGFGANNYSFLSIIIDVPYAWYMHPLALVAWGLLLILGSWLIIKIRMVLLERQNKLLERHVAEKTEKLRRVLCELELSQVALAKRTSLQEKIIASVSHDVRSPMAYLKIVTDQIRKGLESEGNTRFVEAMKLSSDQFGRLYAFLDNLLQYVKLLNRSGSISMTDFSVSSLVQEKIDFFEALARYQETVFIDTTKREDIVYSNPLLTSVMLHNLLDNALKVSARGRVIVDSEIRGEILILRIRDNGPGMSSALIEWINQAGEGGREQEDLFRGLGLYIVKDLAAMMGIGLYAFNVSDGAVVEMRLRTVR